MTHGSLFSGIGGFEHAAEIVGWDNAFCCEIDPFCRRVLKFHFPHETQYRDIRTTDFSVWRGRIDVLTGGFPCQPFSQAGQRKGTDDDRYLWPAMLGAIRQIQPRWIVGENVLGITNWNAGLVFEQVCADLEAEGYQVWPWVLPASGVDAPHRRYRTFFIAHRHDDQRQPGDPFEEQLRQTSAADGGCDDPHTDRAGFQTPGAGQSPARAAGVCARPAAHAQRGGGYEVHPHLQPQQSDGQEPHGDGAQRYAAHAGSEQLQERTPAAFSTDRAQAGAGLDGRPERSGDAPVAAHAGGMPGWGLCGSASGQEAHQVDSDAGLRSWWRDFPTVSPVCGADDGFSDWLDPAAVFEGVTPSKRARAFNRWRTESVKAYGNAVVPPLIVQIFRAIDLYEKLCAA